jgi:hypothetical protein
VQKAREEKTLYTPRCLVVGGRGVHDKEKGGECAGEVAVSAFS